MIWRELELAAPRVARLARERLDAHAVAFLGTVRPDGSPRVSPIEPHLAPGHLLLGLMARSAKAGDLAADPRCVLHSLVTDPEAGEPELKLYGRAEDVADDVRDSSPDAWWVSRPRHEARVVSLAIDEAVHVSWDLVGGRMTVVRWSAAAGTRETTRPYP